MGMIDISYPFYMGMTIYPSNPKYEMNNVSNIETGDLCNIGRLVMGTHTGTHVDAPAHFISHGRTIDQIELDEMNGEVFVVDSTGLRSIDERFLIEKGVEKYHIILFKTDNSARYAGKNILDDYTTLTYSAAEFLIKTNMRMVGIDYMTIEIPHCHRETEKSIHKTILGNDRIILEAINLNNVKEGRYRLNCFPLCINGADGCPVRAVLEDW